MGGTTSWRGVVLDPRSADMMTEVDRLLPDVPIHPTQGSYSGGVGASAGTHDGGGAIDLAAVDLTGAQRDQLVAVMRQVGWAAWLRTPAQSDWPYHVHGIAVQPGGKHDQDCLSRAAHDQVVDYYEGRNGLASNAPDDGPRQYVGTTWETYQPDQPEPAPVRRRNMILVQAPDGRIALVGLSGPAWVHGSDALAEIRQAFRDPSHVAKVDQGTWDRLKAYAPEGAVP